jgi:hypothetical protein
MMEGVESTPYPEATETRMGVTSGLAIQYFAARGGDLVHLVCLVHFVCLVHLVGKRNKRDKLDKLAWLPSLTR